MTDEELAAKSEAFQAGYRRGRRGLPGSINLWRSAEEKSEYWFGWHRGTAEKEKMPPLL